MSRRWLIPVALLLAVGTLGWLALRLLSPASPAPATRVGGAAEEDPDRNPSSAVSDPSRVQEPVTTGVTEPATDPDSVDGRQEPVHGRLTVRVIQATDGRVVPGARVEVREQSLSAAVSARIQELNPALAPTGFVTGADGKAELNLPPGLVFRLVILPTGEDLGQAAGSVRPFTPGEHRSITIELPGNRDLLFYGRVLQPDAARDSLVPMTRAPVRLLQHLGPTRETSTDGDGLFRVEAGAWGDPFVEVAAAGFAPALVELTAGHESAASAQDIPLKPEAVLAGEVLDATGRPQEGATVRLSVRTVTLSIPEGRHLHRLTQEWEACTDPDGRFRVEGLPAGVPVDAVVLRGDRRVLAVEVTLETGVNQVAWSLPTAGRILGRVRDQAAAPVADLEIAAVRTGSPSPAQLADWRTPPDALWTTRTDAQGAFSFEDVPAGSWLLGAVERREDRRTPATVQVSSRLVEVTEHRAVVEVELSAWRDLSISGQLQDPAGRPVAGITVYANQASTPARWNTSDAEGRFLLQPLAPGDTRVRAGDEYALYRLVQELSVPAGTQDLVLTVQPQGGTLTGILLDEASQSTRRGRVSFWHRDGDLALGMTSGIDGTFTYAGLARGTWDVIATDGRGRAGVLQGIRLAAGEVRDDLVVRMTEAGTLLVRSTGAAARTPFQVHQGSARLYDDILTAESPLRLWLPPGRYQVSFLVEGAPTATRTAVVEAGAVTEVNVAADGSP